jgi:hypothetical protein
MGSDHTRTAAISLWFVWAPPQDTGHKLHCKQEAPRAQVVGDDLETFLKSIDDFALKKRTF